MTGPARIPAQKIARKAPAGKAGAPPPTRKKRGAQETPFAAALSALVVPPDPSLCRVPLHRGKAADRADAAAAPGERKASNRSAPPVSAENRRSAPADGTEGTKAAGEKTFAEKIDAGNAVAPARREEGHGAASRPARESRSGAGEKAIPENGGKGDPAPAKVHPAGKGRIAHDAPGTAAPAAAEGTVRESAAPVPRDAGGAAAGAPPAGGHSPGPASPAAEDRDARPVEKERPRGRAAGLASASAAGAGDAAARRGEGPGAAPTRPARESRPGTEPIHEPPFAFRPAHEPVRGAQDAVPAAAPDSPAEPPEHPPLFEQVAVRLSPLSDGPHEVEISLSPEHLGKLTIELRIQGGRMDARLQASSPDACAVLLQDEASLREALFAGGITLDSYTVALAGDLPGERRGTFHPDRGEERSPDGKRHIEPATPDDPTQADRTGSVPGATTHWIA